MTRRRGVNTVYRVMSTTSGARLPKQRLPEGTKAVKELMGYIADHHDALLGMLTDKQKETLEKFDDCYAELTQINEREIYVYAFRLGMRIPLRSSPNRNGNKQPYTTDGRGNLAVCPFCPNCPLGENCKISRKICTTL